VSIFSLGCDAECPSGQRGVAGVAKGPSLPGGSSHRGAAGLWGALCVLPWGGEGMRDWVSQDVAPPCLSGQGSCRCPSQLWAPRPAEDRSQEKISVTLGFSGPFAASLSEGGERGQKVSIFKLEMGSVETETFSGGCLGTRVTFLLLYKRRVMCSH